jgi:hypothetical protein
MGKIECNNSAKLGTNMDERLAIKMLPWVLASLFIFI